MLSIPKRGFYKNEKNLNEFCDWVESSVIFEGEEISRSDVISNLLEEQEFDEQSDAQSLVDLAWDRLRRRSTAIGANGPVKQTHDWIEPSNQGSWIDWPAHSFCLLLSIGGEYSWWKDKFGISYNSQGELFEELSGAALSSLLPDWNTKRIGWGGTNTAKIVDAIKWIADELGDEPREPDAWIVDNAKDVGLDIFSHSTFKDNLPGTPYLLAQCASGRNYETKLKTPDLDVWNKLLNPTTSPLRGFFIPFVLSEDEFKRCSLSVKGLFMDRLRILSIQKKNESWLETDLKNKLIDWCRPRIEELISRKTN